MQFALTTIAALAVFGAAAQAAPARVIVEDRPQVLYANTDRRTPDSRITIQPLARQSYGELLAVGAGTLAATAGIAYATSPEFRRYSKQKIANGRENVEWAYNGAVRKGKNALGYAQVKLDEGKEAASQAAHDAKARVDAKVQDVKQAGARTINKGARATAGAAQDLAQDVEEKADKVEQKAGAVERETEPVVQETNTAPLAPALGAEQQL